MNTPDKKKRGHEYRITIEEVGEAKTLTFTVQDREDLMAIVEKVKQGSGLEENDATRVGVALRLLGPVMMADRKHPLFADFMPHFRQFMNNLKKTIKSTVASAEQGDDR
ncbi:DUF3861 domain-containing protein [Photobacterium aphoticum]|uniref:No significant database hits n=1 Tax=Photobacterium aphoticum TaxID=754436 RepID=A0A090R769_9GAMM|nr:DUF3861 domain-containing protein [Photobacterium aphoticum]KLV00566.1 hypothetical protein ABT58_12280 [Photobacterium aphoticum]PSU59921.1 DUF3861 domain-containing protein [Photobacterium aphoticum]GAL03467.1 no significant database hits [Photobacterium aphoticum]